MFQNRIKQLNDTIHAWRKIRKKESKNKMVKVLFLTHPGNHKKKALDTVLGGT